MRKGLWPLIGLLLLLTAAAVQAQDSVDEEPASIFTRLEAGVPLDDTLVGSITGRVYSFKGTTGDKVTISLVRDPDAFLFLPVMMLLGSAGQVYAVDDTTGDGDAFDTVKIAYKLPADDSYFVFVTSLLYINLFDTADANFDDAQEFTLTASGFNIPPALEETLPIYVGDVAIGEEAQLQLTAAEPIYYVQFVGQADQVIDIITESDLFADDQVGDTLLYLFDPNMNRIAMADLGGDGLAAALKNITLPETGMYTIWATSAYYYQVNEPDWDGEGLLTLRIAEVTPKQ